MSRDWIPDHEECTGVGEVYDTPRYYNARKAIRRALGVHVCGTEEQWAGRATHDPAVNVEFQRNGLPECCGVPDDDPGGLLFAGTSIVGYTAPVVETGNTCPTAVELSAFTPITVDRAAGEIHWWRYMSPVGFSRVETRDSSMGGTRQFYRGSCDFLSLQTTWAGNFSVNVFNAASSFPVWLKVSGPAAETYTVEAFPL